MHNGLSTTASSLVVTRVFFYREEDKARIKKSKKPIKTFNNRISKQKDLKAFSLDQTIQAN